MILFHYRAEIGCRGWNCTSIRAFKGRCPTIRRPGNWWPARVTLPVQRIKSPLHHFNACRPKLVLAAGFAPALATLSTSCLCSLDYASRMKWSLQPVTLRHDFFTKEIRRLLRGGVEWPAEPRLNKRRLACLAVAARRRLVAASGAAPDTAGL